MGKPLATRMKKRMLAIDLVKRLAQCQYPRVRDASISLFLLHPELADVILKAYQTSEPLIAEQIAVSVLATLYLQQLWSFRLTLAFGHKPNFPEQQFAHFWQDRQLPSLQCQQGKQGLEALQAREQQRRGLPLNFIGDWQNQVDHLLTQEEAKHHQVLDTINLLSKQDEEELQECGERVDIEKSLTAL